jgi:hypothetical protein
MPTTAIRNTPHPCHQRGNPAFPDLRGLGFFDGGDVLALETKWEMVKSGTGFRFVLQRLGEVRLRHVWPLTVTAIKGRGSEPRDLTTFGGMMTAVALPEGMTLARNFMFVSPWDSANSKMPSTLILRDRPGGSGLNTHPP